MTGNINHQRWRAGIAGLLITSMIFLTITFDIFSTTSVAGVSWVAGIFGWLAAALLIDGIKPAQRWQIAVIVLIGILMHAVAASRGNEINIGRAIGINAGLISMIAAVGFLRLVVNPGAANESLPVGSRAYYRTMTGVWLFGSVINISAPIIFADRLARRNGLSVLASQSIVRVFTTCSGWSPFFGGMAVVVTYVPNLNLGLVVFLCLPFSLYGFAMVLVEARIRFGGELAVFRGYPVQFSSLWVPALLALIVIFLSWWAPSWSVLTHISLSALVVSVLGLSLQKSLAEMCQALVRQVIEHVPAMVNELSLFLAAGVLAAGLATVLGGDIGWVSEQRFGLKQSVLLLGGMVLLALVGVHPVVTVSGATPLILALKPDPDLLAVVYLLAWSLGTCASPLSGTHLVFQGRYGISSWRAAARNWPFVAVLYISAIPFLYWVIAVLG